MLGKLDSYMQKKKNETGPLSYTIYKIKLKMDKELNVRPGTIKLLEENIGNKCFDIRLINIFWIVSPGRDKTKKWDYIKLKSFCTEKKTINKMKREKIFTNDISNKGLISKMYKEIIQLNNKNTSIKKWTEDMNRHFSKKEIEMNNRQIKKYSTLLIIGEMNIKITMRYYFTFIKQTTIKKTTKSICWRGCGEQGTLIHCWWDCKLV